MKATVEYVPAFIPKAIADTIMSVKRTIIFLLLGITALAGCSTSSISEPLMSGPAAPTTTIQIGGSMECTIEVSEAVMTWGLAFPYGTEKATTEQLKTARDDALARIVYYFGTGSQVYRMFDKYKRASLDYDLIGISRACQQEYPNDNG